MNPFELDFSFTVNLPYKECIGRLRRAQYNHNSLSGTFLERHEELLLDFYHLDDSQWDLSGEWRMETRKVVSVFRISGCLRAETDTTTKLSGRIRARNSWLINLILLGGYLLAIWLYLTFVPGADLFIPALFTSLLVLFLAVGLIHARQRLATIKQRIQDSLGVYSR
jgi:hypothetical protein